jgi:hypothetical protein
VQCAIRLAAAARGTNVVVDECVRHGLLPANPAIGTVMNSFMQS